MMIAMSLSTNTCSSIPPSGTMNWSPLAGCQASPASFNFARRFHSYHSVPVFRVYTHLIACALLHQRPPMPVRVMPWTKVFCARR